MRTTAILVLAAVTLMCACAQSTHSSEHGATSSRVTLCMNSGFDVVPLGRAEKLASKMFAEIGVEIEWSGRADCPSRSGAIVVTVSYETPGREYPGAYAFAKPYEATHIVVFGIAFDIRCRLLGLQRCWRMCWYMRSHTFCKESTGIRKPA